MPAVRQEAIFVTISTSIVRGRPDGQYSSSIIKGGVTAQRKRGEGVDAVAVSEGDRGIEGIGQKRTET